MKHQKLLAVFCLFASSFLPYARAQTVGPITITSSAANSCALIDAAGLSVVGINVSGTWTGTLQPEAAIAGQSAASVQVVPSNSTTPQGTITANGAYTVAVAGWSTFLLCGPTSTGSATIYLKGSDKAISSTRSGGGGGGGSLVPGIQGEPVIYTATSTAGASNQTVDASAFAGADTGAKINAANTALGVNGGTIVVPDSLAGSVSTTIAPSSNVTVVFTGTGTFTGCNVINLGTYSKVYAPAGALLKASGSNCALINQSNSASRQVNDHFIISGFNFDCNAQVGARAIAIANTAQAIVQDTNAKNCTDTASAAYDLEGTQFGEFRRIYGYNNYVCLKIYSKASGGGGNSNNFYGGGCDTDTVGVLLANQSAGGFPQEGNAFWNFNVLSATVAEVAAFSNAGGQQFVFQGFNPEVTSNGGGPVTIDGNTVKGASAYLNGAYATFENFANQEATTAISVLAESGSTAVIRNPSGYGISSGQFCQTDSTSTCALDNSLGAPLGEFQNVTSWPTSLMPYASSSQTTKLYGAAAFAYTNAPNLISTDPMTPSFTDTSGSSSSGTEVDSRFGTVSFVQHAASGGNLNSNRFIFNPLFSWATTSDIIVSVLLKSSVDCSYTIENYADNSSLVTMNLAAGVWTRAVIIKGNAAAASFLLDGFPNCSTGPKIDVAGLEADAEPTGTAASQMALSRILNTGTVGSQERFAAPGAFNTRWESTAAATNGTNKPSPNLVICGQYWNSSASVPDCYTIQDTYNNSANPQANLKITHSGSSGGSQFDLSSLGQVLFPGAGNPFISSSSWNTGSQTLTVGGNASFSSAANLGAYLSSTGVANDTGTGTSNNKLVKLSGAPSKAVIAATSDTTGIIGICEITCSTSGSPFIAIAGVASCVFDGATTAGDYVGISSSVGGDCHDLGAAFNPGTQVLGRVLSTNGGGGTYSIVLQLDNYGSANCAATGTAASPSVVSCSAAAAGAFSCATNASAATCTINTTAVTANSEIFVQEVADEGTRLSVTCNTAPSVTPAILLATKTAGVGFTINMPTITTNPACFDYHIVN